MLRIVFALLILMSSSVYASYGIRLDASMRCPAVENQLGQLLYINVDGFGKGVAGAIHADYIKLVKLLNIGGVAPQFGKRSVTDITEASGALFASTDLPLFIGGELLKVDYVGPFGQQLVVAGNKTGQCDGQHDGLDSYLFKAMGMNHWLGPKDNAEKAIGLYKSIGVFSTFRLPVKITRVNTPIDAIVMTRHKIASGIDNDNVVTLSRRWVRDYNQLLDEQHGQFKGLMLTDAVNKMFAQAAANQFVIKWLKRHPDDDIKAVVAAGALLAGHNMVYLNGVARDTLNVYQQLSMMACRDDVDGRRLQYAIAESFHHISRFKRAHRGALSYRPKMDEKLVSDVLDYKYRLGVNRCVMEDKYTYTSLRERILLAR